MTENYGISSIGMNPLGSYGLNTSGAYGSYGDPMMTMSMMGMNSMNGLYGMNGMSGVGIMNPMMMGMMGMYNPTFMKQMTDAQLQMADAQHQIETRQLNQATQMHEAINQANVSNLSAHQRATFQQIISDGDIQQEIRNLENVVISGDGDAICTEYEKLRSTIEVKYSQLLSQDPSSNQKDQVKDYIYKMYQQITTKDLNEDIKAHGENAFTNGFNTKFLGNKGHNKKYAEQVIAQINDTRLNDAGSKERAKSWGGTLAKITEGAASYAAGLGVGALALGGLKIAANSLPIGKTATKYLSGLVSKCGSLGTWAKVGGLALLGADIIWQLSRDD